MGESLGFSVRIFIPSGEPEGLRVIEKSNWTGQGLSFPRAIYREVRGREELKRTGVYVLWSPGDSGQLPRAYVGEGDSLLERLDSHSRNKDFWTHAVAFISKDQNLNKAHVQRLETRLVEPSQLKPSVASWTMQMFHGFLRFRTRTLQMPSCNLADMLLCLPIVGVSFFNKPRSQENRRQDLFLKGKGISAQGYEDAGGFVVRSGSQAVKEEVASIHTYLSNQRKALLSHGLLEDDGTVYRLVQDYVFSSPSTASGVLLGRASSGPAEWKDRNGRSLRTIQEAAMESP